jgi:hypothetical protein
MPREITTKMGILFEALPDEVEAEKDQLFLAMLLTLLPEDKKQLVRTLLGESYYQAKMRKADKVIAIYENKGIVNVSENPGMTSPEILVSGEELRP